MVASLTYPYPAQNNWFCSDWLHELLTTISWLCYKSLNCASSIYSWLPASQSLPFVCDSDECLGVGGGVTHSEGREELGGAPLGTFRTKHLQRMGSLASVSLFRVSAWWWAGQDASECVPERPGTCGENKNVQNKVRTRGWKGDWRLIPFGYGSLRKGCPIIPFLLTQIICYQNCNYLSIYMIYIYMCVTLKFPKCIPYILFYCYL